MKPRSGVALGTVLLAVVLLATLGMALASSGVVHLHLMTRSENDARARNLARSAVARGIERILDQHDFAGTVRIPAAEGEGVLSFVPEEARELGVACSTNNLTNMQAAEAPDGRVVAPSTVRLMALGRWRNTTRRAEVVLHLPGLDYSLGCAGPIQARSGVTVGRLRGAAAEFDPAELDPSDMVSNADITLGPNSLVTGDVEAAGRIEIQPGDTTVVRGEVKPNQAPAEMPDLELSDYDPAATGRSFENLTQARYDGDTSFDGIARRDGSLTVSGGLKLSETLLFVDGDLVVEGKLEGTGILAVTGRVDLRQGADLAASKLAVMSGGDVILSGRGKHSSFFQGLVYSQGSIRAEEITVIGAMVADGSGHTGTSVFTNATLVASPDEARVSITVPGTTTTTGGGFFSENAQGIHINNSDGRVLPREEWWSRGDHGRLVWEIVGDRIRLAGSNRPGYWATWEGPADDLNTAAIHASRLMWTGGRSAHLTVHPDKWFGPQTVETNDTSLTGQVGGPSTTTTDPTVILVDPSQFLKVEDRIRVYLWHDS